MSDEMQKNLKIVYDDGEKRVAMITSNITFKTYNNFVYAVFRDTKTERKQIVPANRIIRIAYLTKNEEKIVFE